MPQNNSLRNSTTGTAIYQQQLYRMLFHHTLLRTPLTQLSHGHSLLFRRLVAQLSNQFPGRLQSRHSSHSKSIRRKNLVCVEGTQQKTSTATYDLQHKSHLTLVPDDIAQSVLLQSPG